MFRLFRNAVELAHQIIGNILVPGDRAVDATAGNGKDTLFLAELVGEKGKVFAFDIQEEALLRTKAKLEEANLLSRVELIQSGHETIKNFVPLPVKAVMFNLGYLPGGNKAIITKPETTIAALQQSLTLLLPLGIISLTVYTGHPGGNEEWHSIRDFLQALPQDKYDVVIHYFLNRKETYPFTVTIQSLLTSDTMRKGSSL
ncbi:tRNA (mnm(5)s(2)U34)-methyltransferase [Zhaonella formicivorans]|uniref:tRNA (mnm(5)s(2)U34)-methyltransferase n=1 Tax=Zhaonella formicivorans TaxID=2528593 RepID=UPI0010E696CA|nr:class I SAM-dependent methyltransferase [Zhaonella formicivorans]